MEEAARSSGHPLPLLTPRRLRFALRQAGNVVKPEEIDAVLLYAIRDKQIFDLDKLYLALLLDGTVQQLLVSPQPHAKPQQIRKQFFTHRGTESLQLYGLMQNSDDKKIKDCEAWRVIARLVMHMCTADTESSWKHLCPKIACVLQGCCVCLCYAKRLLLKHHLLLFVMHVFTMHQ